jgi:Tfp pilus assembly protein PilZ
MVKERRKMPRYRRRLMVRFRSPDDEKSRSAFTADVGPDGLFVVTSQIEDIGKPLALEVEDEKKKQIKIEGKVVWSKTVRVEFRTMEKTGFGVQIQNPPEEWYRFILKSDDQNKDDKETDS